MYPHSLTGVLASKNRSVIRRNASLLPAYSFLLGLLALLGFAAIAAGVKVDNPQQSVPALFDKMFPGWFAGIAFAAIAIGALVPAAIMSIAAANLWTRNIYKAFINPDATPKQEATQTKLVSLVVKFGALAFVLGLGTQDAINFQLLGGVWILQTMPALVFSLYTRWFHRWALLAGWAVGMVYGTLTAYNVPVPGKPGSHFGGPLQLVPFTETKGYIALTAFVINVLVAVVLTLVLRALKVANGDRRDLAHGLPRGRRRPAAWRRSSKASPAPHLPPGNLGGMTDVTEAPSDTTPASEGHGGDHAVAVAAAHGVDTMFTLSGAHVFPMYDGAVKAEPPMRILDVRHEQTAVFAAEAVGKLTRVPGLAVLTAGPGVTNGVSPITQASFSGSPLVVVGGRAPANRWGMGSLQELDHPPLLAPVTKLARTVHQVAEIAGAVDEAFTAGRLLAPRADLPRRADGPVLRQGDRRPSRRRAPARGSRPTPTRWRGSAPCSPRRPARCWCSAPTCGPTAPRRPRCGSSSRPASPSSPTAWAAASSPAATRCWSPRRAARRSAPPTWSWSSARPLDFRLGYGVFGGKDGAPAGPGRAPRRLPRPGVRARRPRGLRLR